MNNKTKEALRLAIDYIESTASFIPTEYDHIGISTVNACKQALEQEESVESVLVGTLVALPIYSDPTRVNWDAEVRLNVCFNFEPYMQGIPVYTAPPKREWVGLTDAEIETITVKNEWSLLNIIDDIEAKLKEVNGYD